jgi:SAM-dependent methyltransferase
MTCPEAISFYNADDAARWGRQELPEAFSVTRRWLARATPGGVVLELGCGHGSLAQVAEKYVGLDLSSLALSRSRERFPRIAGDMERLPLRDRSVQFIFSWAALEHVPHPELVLGEIERVLVPGGSVLLAPAWHCRPWAAEGLEFKPLADLTPTQRLRKRALPLRNSLVWRGAGEIPRRALRELRARRHSPLTFDYARLSPNLTEYVGTDCDAFTSMDPHAAIMYFLSRGWDVLSHPTFRTRFLARHEPVIARKP